MLLFTLAGPSVIKHHLPQMLALWANAFPKTVKEFDQEKNRGDAYTWHVTLECRAGALCCEYLLANLMIVIIIIIELKNTFQNVTKSQTIF